MIAKYSTAFCKTDLFFIALLSVLGLTGILLAFALPNINIDLFFLINSAGSGLNYFWSVVTYAGDGRFATCVLILLFFLNENKLFASVLSAIAVHLTAQGGKKFFGVLRPENDPVGSAGNFIGPVLEPDNFAFPSGHSATIAMVVMLAITKVNDLRIKLSLLFGAILIALSRVIVGKHWPADIVVGVCLGGLIGIFFSKVESNSKILNVFIYIICFLLSLNVILSEKTYFSDLIVIRSLDYILGVAACLACIVGLLQTLGVYRFTKAHIGNGAT